VRANSAPGRSPDALSLVAHFPSLRAPDRVLAGHPGGPPGDFPELSSDFVLIDRELAAASTEHDKAALRHHSQRPNRGVRRTRSLDVRRRLSPGCGDWTPANNSRRLAATYSGSPQLRSLPTSSCSCSDGSCFQRYSPRSPGEAPAGICEPANLRGSLDPTWGPSLPCSVAKNNARKSNEHNGASIRVSKDARISKECYGSAPGSSEIT
jgi:hypothetical protein